MLRGSHSQSSVTVAYVALSLFTIGAMPAQAKRALTNDMDAMRSNVASIFTMGARRESNENLDVGTLTTDMGAMRSQVASIFTMGGRRSNVEDIIGKLIDEEDVTGDLGGEKPKYEVAGSNMERVGSEEDKAQRKKCAQAEPAWQDVGLEPGVKVWRIEKFNVISWDDDKYGSFHAGDSYIVLHTRADEKEPAKMLHNIHFWIGNETTNDEKGTAAYKTVELDDFFDGNPVQFREELGKESDKFKALFEGGIKYLPGGIDSGFKKATKHIYNERIFQIRKVHKKYMVVQMPWHIMYFNNADSYVVDARNMIYVIHGFRASAFEKYRATSISNDLDFKRKVDDKAFDIGEDGDFCGSLKDIDPAMPGC